MKKLLVLIGIGGVVYFVMSLLKKSVGETFTSMESTFQGFGNICADIDEED